MIERQSENLSNQIEKSPLDRFKEFKEKEGFSKIVGVIGGSNKEKEDVVKDILVKTFNLVKSDFGKFAVLSGGTKDGVPELALDAAKDVGLPTIGVYPLMSKEHAVVGKIDFEIEVPPQLFSNIKWGTETPILVGIPDVFVLIDGSWGTAAEVSMIMKRNSAIASKNIDLAKIRKPLMPSIPIIGIAGSGGFTDILSQLISTIKTDPSTYLQAKDTPELARKIIEALRKSSKI